MRVLVYTCVFGGYDRVFPPIAREEGVDYVIITDDAGMRVDGWHTQVVDTIQFNTSKAPNRHFKMLGHLLFDKYDSSVYVDGNIRIVGPVLGIVEEFLESECAMGVYSHPARRTVEEEIHACLSSGKISDADSIVDEWNQYISDGFPDQEGLVETGVLLKNHGHAELEAAMRLWWSLFNRFDSRDQISLPYVLWKTRLPCIRLPGSFRDPDSSFGIYPHAASSFVSPMYLYFSARAYDSRWHGWVLALWHGKWKIQRRLRKLRGESK